MLGTSGNATTGVRPFPVIKITQGLQKWWST